MSDRPLRRMVVAGNGIAAVTAAEALRLGGFDGDLTIVGAETCAAYSRPALSKEALREADIMTAHLLPEADLDAHLVLGTKVTSLDVDRRLVRLFGGESVPYDGLVIATGSHAKRLTPPALPDRASLEVTLRTVADAVDLRERIAARPDVVVVGSGALAMEIASECRRVGCAVVLVARHAPMSCHVGDYLSGLLVDGARADGVTVRLSPSVTVRADPSRIHVRLGDGSEVSGALLVSAIGDTPTVEWLHGSGLLRDGGLRTDSEGRVRPDVVAAGDVAAFPTSRGVRRMPLWFSAIERAKIAAHALIDPAYAAPPPTHPYFWTEQFGTSIRIVGDLPLSGEPEVIDGDVAGRRALLRWEHPGRAATGVALNYPISVPRLRRLAQPTDITALASSSAG